MSKKWETYEEVAAYLLNQFASHFGLSRVEGKQKVPGQRSGTDWEIDAKGVREGNQGFIIVECRRYQMSKQNQGRMGSLAYAIIDTGAEGVIIVSPLGLQEGAQKIAQAENVVAVRLDPDSTPQSFSMQFLNKIMIGTSGTLNLSGEVQFKVGKSCTVCGKEFTVRKDESVCPDCSSRVLVIGPGTN
jgi:Zn finger protein HypA/HybF involved in hydrogenase expression